MRIELNRIYNEDCVEGMKRIPDGAVDCVLTDPPYLYLKKQRLDRPFDEAAFFTETFRVLKQGGFCAVFGRGQSFYRWNCIMDGLGLEFKEEIIWDKRRPTSPFSVIGRTHETVSIRSKGNGRLRPVRVPYAESRRWEPGKLESDVRRIMSAVETEGKELEQLRQFVAGFNPERHAIKGGFNVTGGNKTKNPTPVYILKNMTSGLRPNDIIPCFEPQMGRVHPTQKPVELCCLLLKLITDAGDTVLDGFMGSGTTAIACINTNRNYIGFEIDKEYYETARRRIREHQPPIPFAEK